MLIQHHTKYEEIHGIDEIVMMTMSDHVKFHNKLRKEDKCKIPADELNKISIAAHRRTEKCKHKHAEYSRTEKCKHKQAAYEKKTTKHIDFSNKIDDRIYLRDRIRFNSNSGSVYISSYIHHPHKDIIFIDI